MKPVEQRLSMFSPDAEAVYFSDEASASFFSRLIATHPLRPFEQLDECPNVSGPTLTRKVGKRIKEGWSCGGISNVQLSPPFPWDKHGRSFSFHIHSWDQLSIIISKYEEKKEFDLLKVCIETCNDWIDRFQKPLFIECNIETAIDKAVNMNDTMAWHDMAVGKRAQIFSYLADVILRSAEIHDSDKSVYLKTLVFHHEVLSRDDVFSPHNNQGFHQAIGQLASAKRFSMLPGFSAYIEKAKYRLEEMLRKSFFTSGPHKEHSPAYHSMVLGRLLRAREAGLLSRSDLENTLTRAEEALGWMIQPDGSLVPFGDTSPKAKVYTPQQLKHFRHAGLKKLLMRDGEKDNIPLGLKLYKDAGYVFARERNENNSDKFSYLSQLSAFHSRAHKHADHLTFVWHDRGVNIFTDPGKYGYVTKTKFGDDLSNQGFYYSDPRRIYVEKTRSHNCVEIDGKDHQRKGVRPFGSALHFADTIAGLWVTLSEIRHPIQVRHFRLLVCNPGHFILVADWLKDGNEKPHDFRQWFQLAPGWNVILTANNTISARNDVGRLGLAGAALAEGSLGKPIQGQTEPEIQGWVSDDNLSLVPATSLYWENAGKPASTFATIFSLSKKIKIQCSSISRSFTSLSAKWTDDLGENDLKIRRDPRTNEVTASFNTNALSQ
ncbi:heparinase II/III family protein [Nitratireductor sp. GZWM139]|uniref:heparinase II/III domain-containing protein n=1 Tax=Nitratireductor sp. GZWM139 TaxID=2950541 RepID=UPI0024BDC29C|nr:heparinase II/III family protein [Nitratireductor sp. GZWM139]MDJ1465799.1 heparinase II/III family protein [Nitratireductor sp. GZWM139]